ncbi:sigma-54-dependent transcriptional regulator [Occallatibacter riparius]|uniref:Sigma-54 dependent transcriptional regulator n=1 Tax=Occallatibacter riparius TaxID=1002689 RepID=A0A9J7BJZ0_9BACT|nr:sigma-54 dependent transcriptional regulator [Occallatibacter riparius]UWZ83144.1 sigma-54 dependent transcriptional regulator [Occallatibacter riparius]
MALPVPVSVLMPPSPTRMRARTAIIASADASFRQRLQQRLTGLRWQIREAETGAQAWAAAETSSPEAVIVDSWLPDLDVVEFLREFRGSFPRVDVLTSEAGGSSDGPRSPYRQELLYALRMCQDTDTAAWNTACDLGDGPAPQVTAETKKPPAIVQPERVLAQAAEEPEAAPRPVLLAPPLATTRREAPAIERLPELIGNASCMLEISRRIRLVAPRSTPVLIEGPTGSGKELVAEALHRLSTRSRKPFIALNCAAIPEALLEAELFGHTRGAFTGAVQGRMGRIEAADGGTLFLDEIGEMPLSLQSKLLRFVECGELQRVGDNETVKVDVRIIAATHRPLAKHAGEGTFRSDLYYRLAVFLIRTPALADHIDDLPLLVNHFLEKLGRTEPVKRIDAGAMSTLKEHAWPGNVRELEHVLERAAILAGDCCEITTYEIDFGLPAN